MYKEFHFQVEIQEWNIEIMYNRKFSGYRPARNVPYSSNAVQNFLAPAVPQMVYPMFPVMQQPAYGKLYLKYLPLRATVKVARKLGKILI